MPSCGKCPLAVNIGAIFFLKITSFTPFCISIKICRYEVNYLAKFPEKPVGKISFARAGDVMRWTIMKSWFNKSLPNKTHVCIRLQIVLGYV